MKSIRSVFGERCNSHFRSISHSIREKKTQKIFMILANWEQLHSHESKVNFTVNFSAYNGLEHPHTAILTVSWFWPSRVGPLWEQLHSGKSKSNSQSDSPYVRVFGWQHTRNLTVIFYFDPHEWGRFEWVSWRKSNTGACLETDPTLHSWVNSLDCVNSVVVDLNTQVLELSRTLFGNGCKTLFRSLLMLDRARHAWIGISFKTGVRKAGE